MTKKPIIILSSFVAILFVAVLYLLYLNIQKPINTIVEKPTPTSLPTQVTDPTADWKTYKDSDNQYSFQYPSSYFVDNKDIPKYLFVMLKGPDYKIQASDYGDKNTGSYYTFGINIACKPTDIVGNRQVILSTSGYTVFSIKGYEGPDYKTALFNKNGLCYEMMCNSETGCVDKQFDDFKTILSTLKFSNILSKELPANISAIFSAIKPNLTTYSAPTFVKDMWQLNVSSYGLKLTSIDSQLTNQFNMKLTSDTGGGAGGQNTFENDKIICILEWSGDGDDSQDTQTEASSFAYLSCAEK